MYQWGSYLWWCLDSSWSAMFRYPIQHFIFVSKIHVPPYPWCITFKLMPYLKIITGDRFVSDMTLFWALIVFFWYWYEHCHAINKNISTSFLLIPNRNKKSVFYNLITATKYQLVIICVKVLLTKYIVHPVFGLMVYYLFLGICPTTRKQSIEAKPTWAGAPASSSAGLILYFSVSYSRSFCSCIPCIGVGISYPVDFFL